MSLLAQQQVSGRHKTYSYTRARGHQSGLTSFLSKKTQRHLGPSAPAEDHLSTQKLFASRTPLRWTSRRYRRPLLLMHLLLMGSQLVLFCTFMTWLNLTASWITAISQCSVAPFSMKPSSTAPSRKCVYSHSSSTQIGFVSSESKEMRSRPWNLRSADRILHRI